MHIKTNKELQAKIRARKARKATIEWTGSVKAYVAVITLIGILFTLLPEALFASSWSPSLLVNTESFQTIDAGDNATNIQLKFGDTLGESLTYDRTNRWFQFSRGIYVSGNVTATGSLSVRGLMSGNTLFTRSNATVGGTLSVTGAVTGQAGITAKGTLSGASLRVSGPGAVHGAFTASGNVITDGDLVINDDLTAGTDAALTFGNATTSQTLKFVHSIQKFSFSTNVRVLGSLSGSSLTVDGNGTFSGNLLVKKNATVKGTISGATINANGVLTGKTLQGFGLYDCNGTNNKLTYNATTKKFLCEGDQTGGGTSGGGISYSTAEAIFVNQSGDTMTGGLAIEDLGGGDALLLSGGILRQSGYGSPTMLSGANISSPVRTVYVSGKLAFVGYDSVSGNDLQIFDIHNRSNPTLVGGIDVGASVNIIIALGRYLYVGTSAIAGTCTRGVVTGCELRLYDVSNPASPVAIGGADVANAGGGVGVNDIQIIGELAYVANDTITGVCSGSTGATILGCEFRVYDVSNPYGPQAIGGLDTGVDARSIYIAGSYAYVVFDSDSSTGQEFRIISIKNHSAISTVGGVDAGVAALNFNTIAISGKYAYIGTSADASTCSGSTVTGCEFRIYDVGNPASPSAVSGLNFGITLNALEIEAKWVHAGLGSNAGKELVTIDVGTPSAPLAIGGSEMGVNVNALTSAGKYLYLGSDTVSGNEFYIMDGEGLESPAANIGSLQTSNVVVTEGMRINNGLYVGNGINVGRGGVNLRGPLSVQSTSTGSLFTGLDVKNLTGTTMFSVTDNGFADAMRGAVSYNGMLAQEFNDEKASATADATTWGDDGTWVMDVSTTTCAFMVNETWPSAARTQITAASVGCNQYLGIAAGDPMNFISATGSLARVLMKVRVGSTTSTQRIFAGLFAAAAANNVTEPTEGIYFTGSGASYTEWNAVVNPANTGVSTYVRCPGATIRTGVYQYALLDITFEATSRVRFRVDPDTSDGISFINCGWVNPNAVKNFLGVGLLHNTTSGFSGTSQVDVDYIRVWTQ